jgi:hypothetical protein
MTSADYKWAVRGVTRSQVRAASRFAALARLLNVSDDFPNVP